MKRVALVSVVYMGETNSIRNNEMKDAFFDLSKVVWQMLKNQCKSRKHLLTVEKRKANWTQVGLIISKYHEYNMNEFLSRHMSIIRKIPEFKQCIEVMKKDDVVKNHLENRVGSFTNASLLQTPMVVEKFLKHLMSEVKGFDLDISSFLKVYQIMEDFFYTDTVEVEVFVHLEGFESKADRLDFGNGWEISAIPQTQLDGLLSERLLEESHKMSQHALYWRLQAPKYVLKNEEEFESPLEYQSYQTTVRRIVSALRLFKSGDIGFRRIIQRYKGWLSPSGGMSTSVMKPFWGSYSLEPAELDDFRQILDTILSAPENPAFELSLKRLNDAIERQHPYDMMIDYMIAFEALFLFKDDRKKPILPKRVATLIHKDASESDTIVEHMESAYDLRNSIAHGDTESEIRDEIIKTGYTKREFTTIIGNYLRRAMKEYLLYLSKGCTKEKIISKLKQHH